MSFDRSPLRASAVVWLLALALSASAAGISFAEDGQAPAGGAATAQQAPDKPAPVAAAQPASAGKPGPLQNVGRWLDESMAGLRAKMKDAGSRFWDFNKKSNDAVKGATTATQDAMKTTAAATQQAMRSTAEATQEAMKTTAEASKDAATAIIRLPNTRVVEVRERCMAAPNGAPDCQAAAAEACRGKGFSAGQPVDVRSGEKCPPGTLLSGQEPAENVCQHESVVTRVVCQ